MQALNLSVEIPPMDELPPIEDLDQAGPDMTIDNCQAALEDRPELEDLAFNLPQVETTGVPELEEEPLEENLEELMIAEDLSAEIDEAQEQKRWTKRAQQMLHSLDRELTKKENVDFKSLSRKSNRKQAAYKFYTLLILNKEKAIKISEDGLYGKITIVKGDNFDQMV